MSESPLGRGPCDTKKIKTGRGRSSGVCVCLVGVGGARQGGNGQIADASRGGREASAARDRGMASAMQHEKK